MLAHALLAAVFLLTIGHLITLKLCSAKLDHRTAPIFISFWTLLGVAAAAPFYGHLLPEGWAKIEAQPWLLPLICAKGALLYLLFVVSQELMKESLSSRHYVTPLSIGFMSLINASLGEKLTGHQWAAVLSLFTLSAMFFFKGHLSELSRKSKITYAKLVTLSVLLSSLDHTLTKNSNWFTLLLISNIVLIFVSISLNPRMIRTALLNKTAVAAGFFYAATELVKFYQQVSINPVTVVVTVQAATKPVILILSALLWKERTVREQLLWGALAFAATLPLFF